MNVLVACEYSGIVRDAFRDRGHNAISVDILPTESEGPHYRGDIFDALDWESGGYFDFLEYMDFDLIIAHPPCTYLTNAGNRWYGKQSDKFNLREEAAKWTESLWFKCLEHGKRVCFENPQGVLASMTTLPKPQYIQPYQFGHPEQKKTGLHLYNLPPLEETNNVYEEMMKLPKKERERVFYMSPGKDRGKERSKFYTGIAGAMADQWGGL